MDANEHHVRCLKAYVDALRAVDPTIEIIADGNSPAQAMLIRKELGNRVNYLVDHLYAPWGQRTWKLGDIEVPIEKLTAEDVWKGWVAVAPFDPLTGNAVMRMPLIDQAKQHGYPVAVTEWNFNGWWQGVAHPPLDSDLARGLGAAGMLHALMRSGNAIKIACQSMTVGRNWGITAIRVDESGKTPPYYLPTGRLMGFYSKHHGDRLLRLDAQNVPTYAQPYRFNAGVPSPRVAHLDTLITADNRRVYIHVINRHFNNALPFEVDLSSLTRLKRTAKRWTLTGRLENAPGPGESREVSQVTGTRLALKGRVLRDPVPPRSINCYEIDR
jgi:alpha-L-arabinofuranosidase